MEKYRDAYEVLLGIDQSKTIDNDSFENHIRKFVKEYLRAKDFDEKIKWHKEPVSFINEILNELYSYLLKIQSRNEMRHFEANTSGYVPTKIIDLWKSDKRIKSLYNSTLIYCKLYSKDFNTIGIHIAEYRAMNLVVRQLRRKLNPKPAVKKAIEINEAKPGKKQRPKIPKENKVRAELQKEIGSVCPFCQSTDVGHFHVHHIDEEPANNMMNNLLLICPTCHSKITKGDILLAEVIKKKESLMGGRKEPRQRR